MARHAAAPQFTLCQVRRMHGNSSCRLSALEVLESALAEGCMLFTFDFCGSGLSEGEYVSLGHYEKDDLQAVVAHLRESGAASTIALWGRSMGAATALLHGHRDPSIAAMVLDSPFASLKQLARELVAKGKQASGYNVPDFVVSVAISWVTSSVQKKAAFDMNKLTPIADVDKCFIPALFVAGRQDDFIAPHHAQDIHDQYAGDKNISLVVGQHNSPRPGWWKDSAAIFLRQYMQIPEGLQLDRGNGDTLQAAWNRAMGGGAVLGGNTQRLADAEAAMMRRAMQASMAVGSAGGTAGPSTAAAAGGSSSQTSSRAVAHQNGGEGSSVTGASKDAPGAAGSSGGSTAAAGHSAAALPPAPPLHIDEEDDPGLAVAIALSLQEAETPSASTQKDS